MPYLITTSRYPSDKNVEVAEKYLEAMQKYPPDENLETEVVPAAVKSTHKGLKITMISAVKEGKFEQAYNRRVQYMVLFQSIQGFEYTIDVNMTVVEALGVLGMNPTE